MNSDDKLNGMCKEKGDGSYYSQLYDEMYSKMNDEERKEADNFLKKIELLLGSDEDE